MLENKLKRLLRSGGTAIGTMVCDTRSPAIAQALAVSGFDFGLIMNGASAALNALRS